MYNALKLFMEINPDLFDEVMQHYKQRKMEYVLASLVPCVALMILLVSDSTRSLDTTSGRSFGKRPFRIAVGIYRMVMWT